jgi:gliding motility-associated-like protein
MKLSIAFLFLLAFPVMLYAQSPYSSEGNFFTVSQKKGCAPLSITLNASICEGNSCDIWYMFTGNPLSDLNISTSSVVLTYTQPGTHKLRLLQSSNLTDQITMEIYPNIAPAFDIYTCGGREISVKIPDTNYPSYIINFGDGSTEQEVARGVPSANYAYDPDDPGDKTVTVRGKNPGAADNCNFTSKTVTLLATLQPPTIDLVQVIDAATIKLNFDALPNIQYKLEVATNNTSTFQQLKTVYNIITDTIRNLRADDNYYCFRLGAFDPCNNITAYSSTICSANFDLQALNNENRLRWTSGNIPGILSSLTKTTARSGSTIPLVTSPYSDTDIECGTRYCYQLTTTYTNGSQSLSLIKCDTAISNTIPPAVENINVIAGQGGALLQWQQVTGPTPKEFTVLKSMNGTFSQMTTTAMLQATDSEYAIEQPSCYKILYEDVCKNVSPESLEACPVLLNGTLQEDNSVSLTWTPYSGWRNGVASYTIEKYDMQYQLIESRTVGLITDYIDTDAATDLNNQFYRYVIIANSVDGGDLKAVSNIILITKNVNLHYPTAFTPNDDDLNDVFTVFGQYVKHFEMNIFNRWGELMFTTNNMDEGWNGKFKGNKMPEGAYTFVAKITDLAGRTFKRSGNLILLQKGN